MKTEFILFPAVILSIHFINVNCIVPKHLQSIEHPTIRQIFDFKDRESRSKRNEVMFPLEEKLVNMYFIKEPYINFQSKYGYKNIIDSAEVDKNAPVEDFDDYSVEEVTIAKQISIDMKELNSANSTFRKLNASMRSRPKRNVFERKDRPTKKKLSKIRQKRIPAMYTGRYKSLEVNDIQNSIPKLKPKSNSSDNKLKLKVHGIPDEETAKVRSKRNPNNIIEEENLGTTISGFKFTGRLVFLNNNLVFKNIHS